jgi:glucosamine--fructose-6-phosphate aminotransferase (isomerizing)
VALTHFEREIAEQPAALALLLARGRAAVEEIAAAVRRFDPGFVVTAARGSSDNAARFAKYLLGAHNRLVVSLGAPSLVTLYQAQPALGRALVVGVSQSGESPDVVALVEEGRRQGALTVAVTNGPGSPLARAAEHVLDLQLGPEESVVASKSYTAQLGALAMLSAAMEGDPARWQALERLPDAMTETLALCAHDRAAGARWTEPFGRAERLVVLGRGFNYATAFEIALKIKETAYLQAEPYAPPDLLHGPMAMIEGGLPALLVAPRGAASADLAGTLAALAERGAEIAVISDDGELLRQPGVRLGLPLAAGVEEWLSPITAVLPGQLWALALAQARGLDPDRPRGLTKVTRTR